MDPLTLEELKQIYLNRHFVFTVHMLQCGVPYLGLFKDHVFGAALTPVGCSKSNQVSPVTNPDHFESQEGESFGKGCTYDAR